MDPEPTTTVPTATDTVQLPPQIDLSYVTSEPTANGTHTPPESGDNYPVFCRIAAYLNTRCPTGNFTLTYLTEGGANTIWLIRFSPSSNLYLHDSKLILRVRKDIPTTIPMATLRTQFEEHIVPLFQFDPGLLLPVHLIEINDRIEQTLNAQLRDLETNGQRKEMRRGIYHAPFDTEPYAMLMPNLAYGDGKVIEFKPKWLMQSPSAPRDAQRCRTCALNAMRRETKQGSGRGDSGFCPLNLLAQNDQILIEALRHIWSDEKTLEAFMGKFKQRVQPALSHLQRLQFKDNGVGLEDFRTPETRDFSVAMALRDCSVVLKATTSQQINEIQIPLVKFIDLDLKDSRGGKVKKWANIEQDLITGGWYSSQNHLGVQCAISRTPSNPVS